MRKIQKLWAITKRDLLVARRDALMLYILVMPFILAVALQFLAPNLYDTTLNFVLLESDNQEHIAFMENSAKVELFSSEEALERRVLKRDQAVGFLPLENGTYEIVIQGNEDTLTVEQAKAFQALYQMRATQSESTAKVFDFGLRVIPLKTKLLNMLILMSIMLAGMLIALGIVEEKQSNTVQAVRVSPLSINTFILGKSLMGGVITLITIVGALFITGYSEVHWAMLLLVGLSSMVLSGIVGFLQGVHSNDIMEAAAGVKMLMLPIAGSIAGYELLGDTWQWTMYWSPFYWAYRANDLILSQNAQWSTILPYIGFIGIISGIVYLISMPKIRKGLQ